VEFLSHLVFAAFAATGVALMIKRARLHDHYRWPLLAILLTPNFGVWASVIGRESLFVGLLGFFVGAVLGYWRRPGFLNALLALVCLAGMIFIRAPYGIGLSLFFLMFLLYRSGPRVGLSAGVQALLFLVVSLLVLMWLWPFLDDYITGDVLPKAKGYFTISSETTRTWIQMETTATLLKSLWWSLPLALVGPTPSEVMARPLMSPFFLSGVVHLLQPALLDRRRVQRARGKGAQDPAAGLVACIGDHSRGLCAVRHLQLGKRHPVRIVLPVVPGVPLDAALRGVGGGSGRRARRRTCLRGARDRRKLPASDGHRSDVGRIR
jgi:hypothetical protein